MLYSETQLFLLNCAYLLAFTILVTIYIFLWFWTYMELNDISVHIIIWQHISLSYSILTYLLLATRIKQLLHWIFNGIVYFIHFFNQHTFTEGPLFSWCLEINYRLEKLTGNYVIIIKHSKDYYRGIHKNYERKQKRRNYI